MIGVRRNVRIDTKSKRASVKLREAGIGANASNEPIRTGASARRSAGTRARSEIDKKPCSIERGFLVIGTACPTLRWFCQQHSWLSRARSEAKPRV